VSSDLWRVSAVALGWLLVLLGAVFVTFAIGTVTYLIVEFDCPDGVGAGPCSFSLDSGTWLVYSSLTALGCVLVALGWRLRRR